MRSRRPSSTQPGLRQVEAVHRQHRAARPRSASCGRERRLAGARCARRSRPGCGGRPAAASTSAAAVGERGHAQRGDDRVGQLRVAGRVGVESVARRHAPRRSPATSSAPCSAATRAATRRQPGDVGAEHRAQRLRVHRELAERGRGDDDEPGVGLRGVQRVEQRRRGRRRTRGPTAVCSASFQPTSSDDEVGRLGQRLGELLLAHLVRSVSPFAPTTRQATDSGRRLATWPATASAICSTPVPTALESPSTSSRSAPAARDPPRARCGRRHARDRLAQPPPLHQHDRREQDAGSGSRDSRSRRPRARDPTPRRSPSPPSRGTRSGPGWNRSGGPEVLGVRRRVVRHQRARRALDDGAGGAPPARASAGTARCAAAAAAARSARTPAATTSARTRRGCARRTRPGCGARPRTNAPAPRIVIASFAPTVRNSRSAGSASASSR